MATWHQSRNAGAMAALYRPKAHVWRVVDNKPNEFASAIEFDNEKAAQRLAKRNGGVIINPPPRLPFVIRRKYFADSKSWELFAVFPTLAADSSSYYNMQGEAENGDSFSCSHEYFRSSRHIRGIDPARVAEFESRIRRDWESDTDSPFSLIRYERVQHGWHWQREQGWRKGRA